MWHTEILNNTSLLKLSQMVWVRHIIIVILVSCDKELKGSIKHYYDINYLHVTNYIIYPGPIFGISKFVGSPSK